MIISSDYLPMSLGQLYPLSKNLKQPTVSHKACVFRTREFNRAGNRVKCSRSVANTNSGLRAQMVIAVRLVARDNSYLERMR